MYDKDNPAVVRRIEVNLETQFPEVAAYFGAYADGIQDTSAWIARSRSVLPNSYGHRGGNQYRWALNLKERINIAHASTEEIKLDFERQIQHGLDGIFHNDTLTKRKFNLTVTEIPLNPEN